MNEIDVFMDKVVGLHAQNWRLLRQAAQSTLSLQHGGTMVAGEFHRGPHRGQGKAVNAIERDRVRALQLMAQAFPSVREEPGSHDVSYFYSELAQMLINNRGAHQAWRLQYLSDLTELPDYEDGWGVYYRGGTSGAPVDADGKAFGASYWPQRPFPFLSI